MSRPTFLHGAVVAAVLAFFASAVIAALTPFVGLGSVLRLTIPALGLAYLLYLTSRSTERIGRVTTFAGWSVLAVAAWWFAPPLPLYLLLHVGAIWLIRSLYFHSGVLPALLDLGLGALSVAAAVWALGRSGSAFLATWCFFLTQALFVAIPSLTHGRAKSEREPPPDGAGFDDARRRAEAALNELFSR